MNAPIEFPRATLDDLMSYDGGAELINGRIVPKMPHGRRPNVVAGRIFRKLADYADDRGGTAFTDGIGFAVPVASSGRESFSPDVSYYAAPLDLSSMRFVEDAPTLAIEVRSENDYGPKPEREMASKRAEYFEAGTLVVWDVDPVAGVVRRYRPGDATPAEFRAGDEADAEPAAPGWRVMVDWLMR